MASDIVQYATKSVHPAPFPMDYSYSTLRAVDALAGDGGSLEKAGWTRNGGTRATVTIHFPFGIIGFSGSPAYLCEIPEFAPGAPWPSPIWYVAYIPVPGSVPPIGNVAVIFVVYTVLLDGTIVVDQPASFASMAAIITNGQTWDAAVTAPVSGSDWVITLTAKHPGTIYNYLPFNFNGVNAVITFGPAGGGWTWQSQPNSCGSTMQVGLTAAGGNPTAGNANLVVTLLFPRGTVFVWFLGFRARWQFWANEYSFCFFVDPADDITESGFDATPSHNFLYAGVPKNVDLDGAPSSSAFAIYDSARALNVTGGQAACELNGVFWNVAFSDNSFAVVVPYTASLPLTGKSAQLMTAARCALPVAAASTGFPNGQVYLVGFLFDAVVVTKQYVLGSLIRYDGRIWKAMLTQAGASLFIAMETV